jgi:hypothetical protein
MVIAMPYTLKLSSAKRTCQAVIGITVKEFISCYNQTVIAVPYTLATSSAKHTSQTVLSGTVI